MRETNVFLAILLMFALIILSIAVNGCTSVQAIPDRTLIEHNNRVAELERTVDDLTGRIERHGVEVRSIIIEVGDIRARASSITSATDRLAYLFGEYERIVYELLSLYELLQAESNGAETDNILALDSTGNSNSMESD